MPTLTAGFFNRRRQGRKMEQTELLSFCPFDLVPGAKGKALLWWSAERAVVATFPSLAVANNFIIGSHGGPEYWGWDKSDPPGIDVKAALYRYRLKHGSFPQFVFDENSKIFDLYCPL